MGNLLLLLKNHYNEELGISRFRFEKEPSKRMRALIGKLVKLCLVVLIITAFYVLGRELAEAGYSDVIPVFGYVIGTAISFVVTILKINEMLAGKEDAEYLMSLPISTFIQVLAIFLNLYLWNLLLILMTNVPMIISYAQNQRTNPGFWILWGIGVLLNSLPVVGAAALLGTFLALILAGIRNSNLIHSIITLLIFMAAAIFFLNMGNRFVTVLGNGANVVELIHVITRNYKLGYMYQYGVVQQQPAWMAVFFLISAIWHVFFLFFMSMSYEGVIQALRCPKVYRNFTYGTQKQKKMEEALFAKEVKQWLHSRSYMVSSLPGVFIALLLSLALLIKGPGMLLMQFGIPQFYGKVQWAVPFLLAALLGASCTTYCSFSIEGRRHWIVETMPVDERIMGRSKWKLNLMITVPAALVCGVLLVIAFRPGAVLGVCYFLIPIAYAFCSAWWGLFVDYRYGDYSSESENQVLRGNTSFFVGWIPGVLLPLIIGLGILLI